jgi:hypothetical protein
MVQNGKGARIIWLNVLKLSEKLGVILSDIIVADNIVIQDYIKIL